MTLPDLRDRRFPLAELAALTGRLLDEADVRAEDGRLGALDERTLRYWQTLGLLDRPLTYEGRQAVYGYRHLLQALSVRLLQARGHSLAQAQTALTGVDSAALELAVLSALPAVGEPAQPQQAPAPAPAPAPRPVLAAEVAPGVTVLLDARHAADASSIFARIAALFPAGGPS